MEEKGEKLLKKAKKMPKGIWIGYLICLIILVLSSYSIDNKEQSQIPEAIDLSTNGAMEMEENKYAY